MQKEEKQVAWASVSAKSGHCWANASVLWEEQREGTAAEPMWLLWVKQWHKDVITVSTTYKIDAKAVCETPTFLIAFWDKIHCTWTVFGLESPVAKYQQQWGQGIIFILSGSH